MRKTILFISFCTLTGLVLFTNLFCNEEKSPKEELLYLNHSDTVDYVGMETCRACHNDIYRTFIETGMGQSFGKATRKKSAARFRDHDAVYDRFSGYHYKPFWKNDEFFIMEYRLNGKDTVHKRTEKVSYIIGSGHHTNSHIMEVNGYLFQMPLTFYTQQGRWDLPPGFENGNNTRFSRTIQFECMSCHNAYPKFIEGSLNKYAKIPEGIDCERCHGPGEVHVQQKILGKLVDTSKYIDYTIVNPKKLPYELQVDVCQRCHLQGNAVLREGKTFSDFKPGMPLSDYINVFMPKYEGRQDEFIMASHSERLQMSKCFIRSNQKKIRLNSKHYENAMLSDDHASLTCISCHNPHVSVKATGNTRYNNTCKGCHEHAGLNLPDCREKLSVRKLVNDNCSGCHMPRSGTIDIPHVTVTDHLIQVPVQKAKSNEIRKFIGLSAINNKAPGTAIKGEAYLAYFEKFEAKPEYIDSAFYYLKRSEDISPHAYFIHMVRLHFLKQDYGPIRTLAEGKPAAEIKDSWTNYRIGEAWYAAGNMQKAYEFYIQAVNLAPYNLDFRNKLGSAAANSEKLSEAKDAFEFIIRENPKFVAALSNLGFIYLREKRVQEAEQMYRRALDLDPDYEPAIMNMAGLYLYRNEPGNAKKLLEQVIRKNPGNERAKNLLQRL